jgi:peptidyl-prolyl cis-trans isomerase C
MTWGCRGASITPNPTAPGSPETALARIGEEALTRGQFQDFLEERFPESSNPIPQNDRVLSELLDEAVNDRLVLQEAARQGLMVSDKEVQEYLSNTAVARSSGGRHPGFLPPSTPEQRAREILLADKHLNALLTSVPPVSAAEERQYFNSHEDAFQDTERYHIEEILVKDKPLAEAIEQMLAKRRSFESLAEKYSQKQAANNGSDVGWFARGELPEQLEKAVWGLKMGAHSGVVQTDYGFHIFKVKEIRPAHKVSFEQAREKIHATLLQQHKNAAVASDIERLRKNTRVVIEYQNLNFKYISDK